MNNLFYKDEPRFWDELLLAVMITFLNIAIVAVCSAFYVVVNENFSFNFSFALFIIFTSISIIFLGFDQLKEKSFRRVNYFWLYVIPVLNIFTVLVYFIHLGYVRFKVTMYKYSQIYKECAESEFENTLQSVLDHSKRMNDKIQKIKSSCNSKTDKLILDIMEENQRTINILKS